MMSNDAAWKAYLVTCRAHSIPLMTREAWEASLVTAAAAAEQQDAAAADRWKPHERKGYEHAHSDFRPQGDGPDMAQADQRGDGVDHGDGVDVDPHDQSFATKAELKRIARARKFGRQMS